MVYTIPYPVAELIAGHAHLGRRMPRELCCNVQVYSATSAAGPFVEIPNSNSTGCYINPSPLYHDGSFFCTGQKGGTMMTAKQIGGPPSPLATDMASQCTVTADRPEICALYLSP